MAAGNQDMADFAELLEQYATYSRAALEYQMRAQVCLSGILHCLADGDREELSRALKLADTLRLI